MTGGRRRSQTMTDSLDQRGAGSQTAVCRLPGVLEGIEGSPRLNFSFDLQEVHNYRLKRVFKTEITNLSRGRL